MRTAMTQLTILPPCRAAVIAVFGPTGVGQDRGRDRARRAAARARARTRSRSRPTRCRSTTGLEILTGAADAAEQRAARAPAARLRAGRRDVHRRRLRAARARGDRRAARGRAAPDRRRRHRALPARRARRARPAPAGRPEVRARWQASWRDDGPAALHAELPGARPRSPPASRPTDAPAHHPRARAARRRPAPAAAGRRRSCGPTDTRHPTLLAGAGDGPRRAATRGSTRASTRWSRPGAARRGASAPTPPAPRPPRAPALGFEELLAGDVEAMKTRTRRYAKRQLTWLRKLPGVAPDRRHRPRRRRTSPPSCTP